MLKVAAIAYGLDKKDEKNIVVFDLGGGTFDVSILTIDNGVFELLPTFGNTHSGVKNFNKVLFDFCIAAFKKHNMYKGVLSPSLLLNNAYFDSDYILDCVKDSDSAIFTFLKLNDRIKDNSLDLFTVNSSL